VAPDGDLLAFMCITERLLERRMIRIDWALSCLGIILFLGTSVSVAEAQVPTAELREEARVGSVWDEDRMLAQVGSVAVYGDSLLLVIDRFDDAIKIFDWSGEPVGQIGRRGQGPGEFHAPGQMKVRNDTIFVVNAGSRSLILLDISGKELARFSLPFITVGEGTSGIPAPSGLFPDGTFLGMPTARMPQMEREDREYHLPVLKVGRSGEILDTLALYRSFSGKILRVPDPVPLPAELPSDLATASSTLGIVAIAQPSPPDVGARYRITSIRHTGDTIFSRLFDFQPQRISREMKAALAQDYGGIALRSQRVMDALVEAYGARPHLPPVSGLHIGLDGRIWVRRESVPGGPIHWEVLGQQGDRQFRLGLPDGVLLRLASADHLWIEEKDDLGVPFIVRYRIEVPTPQAR